MTEQNEKNPSGRVEVKKEPPEERILHFREFTIPLTAEEQHAQAARCLGCGTAYCSSACPLHNRPVDFNRLVADGRWREAWECLNDTNSFPEFTSRVCPALCEAGCTRYFFEDSAVGVRSIERAIADRAWKSGWVKPEVPLARTGKRVAVVGSGPAGLACAQQLARAGHRVTVYEKNESAGGLLAFGIPDFKLSKRLLGRRIEQMKAEGVSFRLGCSVGTDAFEDGVQSFAKETVSAESVTAENDAVVLALGSEVPRDLKVPGREGKGVHYAMDFLVAQNRALAGLSEKPGVTASGLDVAVIGGGDTGADCVGTCRRQGAGKVYLIAHGEMPPEKEDKLATWPEYPRKLRTPDSLEEGCERLFGTETREVLLDENGEVRGLRCVKLAFTPNPEGGRPKAEEVPGSEFEIPVQRVLIAMGFSRPSAAVLEAFGVKADSRGNALASGDRRNSAYETTVPKVFACGDARRGQSLVVHAISEGRQCAAAVDRFLMGRTILPEFGN